MNDDRQAGRKEIGGGGEWTALREALEAFNDSPLRLDERTDCMEVAIYGRPHPTDGGNYAALYRGGNKEFARLVVAAVNYCAALAAAAPAPPANLQVGHDESRGDLCEGNSSGLHTESPSTFAPPPQDGQGAELLGPPRGGSSSDLAGPSNLGAVARQAREYYKTLLNNANMCAAAWLIHEAPIVTGPPSKAEREVASATSNLSVQQVEKIHKIIEQYSTDVIDYELATDDINAYLWRAVAGNASAPVGEKRQPSEVQQVPVQPSITQRGKNDGSPVKRDPANGPDSDLAGQPSGVGEPRTLADLADEIVEAMPYGKMSDANIREAILPVLKKALSTLSPNEGASSPADARTELVQKEVGEGLREGDEVLLRAKIYHIRVAGTNPRCARDFKLMVKDGDEEHVLFVTAAALAPAPKPAPPAEPQIYAMCICSGYHDDGWVNPNCPVHGTLRRAAERKPPR